MNRIALAALFALTAAAFLVSPSPQYASEADCGPNSGKVCFANESCAGFLFFKQCTTKYKYYPGPEEAPEEEEAI